MTWSRRPLVAILAVALGLVGPAASGAAGSNDRAAASSVSFPGLGGVFKVRVAPDASCGEDYLEYVVGDQGTRATHYYVTAKILDPLDRVVGQATSDLNEVGTSSYVLARFCRSGIYTIIVKGSLLDLTNGIDETVGSVNDSEKFDVAIKRYLYTPQIKTKATSRTLKATIYPSCGSTIVQKYVKKKWVTKKTFKARLKCIDSDRNLTYKATSAGKWRFKAPATKYSKTAYGKSKILK